MRAGCGTEALLRFADHRSFSCAVLNFLPVGGCPPTLPLRLIVMRQVCYENKGAEPCKTIGYLMLRPLSPRQSAQARNVSAGGNTVIQKGKHRDKGAKCGGPGRDHHNIDREVILPSNLSVIPYPGSSGWSGYWGYQAHHGRRVLSRGLASIIRAKGEYNLATSAAAVNFSIARNREIENDKQWVNAYFELRDLNKQQREAEIDANAAIPRIFHATHIRKHETAQQS